MTTFSQLVDSMVRETRRPDMLPEIVSYLNQTLREVHFTTQQESKAIFFRDNFVETSIIATREEGNTWYIPDPATFQGMQVVRYTSNCGRGPDAEYPAEVVPSRGLSTRRYFYYRTGSAYVFSGYGGIGAIIGLGYYEYPRRLQYYIADKRPAEYESDTGWSYNPVFAGDETLRIAAQTYTSNWLLLRWRDVIEEGVRAKVYKRVSDTDRARTCYSLYSSLRQGLESSESAALGGYA